MPRQIILQMLDRNLADIIMQGGQMAWGVAGQGGLQGEQLRMWDQTSESKENAEFTANFRTGLCPDLTSGNCPKGKSPSDPTVLSLPLPFSATQVSG